MKISIIYFHFLSFFLPFKGMKSLDSPTTERHHYGNFTFDIKENESFQTFAITKLASESYQLVQVNFHANHGNHNTCVYKIRLHGVVDEDQ